MLQKLDSDLVQIKSIGKFISLKTDVLSLKKKSLKHHLHMLAKSRSGRNGL